MIVDLDSNKNYVETFRLYNVNVIQRKSNVLYQEACAKKREP